MLGDATKCGARKPRSLNSGGKPNSDDKPRHLALCVNSLSIAVPRGIASVTGYC